MIGRLLIPFTFWYYPIHTLITTYLNYWNVLYFVSLSWSCGYIWTYPLSDKNWHRFPIFTYQFSCLLPVVKVLMSRSLQNFNSENNPPEICSSNTGLPPVFGTNANSILLYWLVFSASLLSLEFVTCLWFMFRSIHLTLPCHIQLINLSKVYSLTMIVGRI
jgi:hypothetical protein